MAESFPEKPIITTVAALITRQEGDEKQVLLTRRGYPPYKDQWCLPGGHIENNVPAREAVIREVEEEVGLKFTAQFFAYFDEIIPTLHIHAVVLVFDGPASGILRAQPGEVLEIKWFTFEDAGKQPLAFQHNQILLAYQESKGK